MLKKPPNKKETQRKEPKDTNNFDEIIPPKNKILYDSTLYHNTNALFIQWNHIDTWVNKEYLILKDVIKKKEKHNIELEQA